jgi:hypothetical protein
VVRRIGFNLDRIGGDSPGIAEQVREAYRQHRLYSRKITMRAAMQRLLAVAPPDPPRNHVHDSEGRNDGRD